MKNIFIGVDPGKSGFFTIYDPTEDHFAFIAMPEHKVETGKSSKSGKAMLKSEFDPNALRDITLQIHTTYPNCTFHATIEEVGGRQGWSAQNNFNFGHTAGLQMMVLIILKATIHQVRPIKWQTYMYQGFEKIMIPSSTGKTKVHDTKATSAMVAQSLYPQIDFKKTQRSKTIDDNKTDSFLMCLYGYRLFLKNK